jgi:hypothetical protein
MGYRGQRQRSGRRRWGPVLIVLAVASSVLATAGPAMAPPGTGVCFTSQGLDGGGMTNVVAIEPNVTGRDPVVLAGGDGSGISRSTDFGRTWKTANSGWPASSNNYFAKFDLAVAGIAFSPVVPGRAYALTRTGVIVSNDGGLTWAGTAAGPKGDGDDKHLLPRITGGLIVIEPALRNGQEVVYVGSEYDGVWRTTDAGAHWTALDPRPKLVPYTPTPQLITGMVYDRYNDVLYVSAQALAGNASGGTGGIYMVSSPSAANPLLGPGNFKKLGGNTPPSVEELAIAEDTSPVLPHELTLFAASDLQGLWSADMSVPNPSPAWVIHSVPHSYDSYWVSVTSYTGDDGHPVVLAGQWWHGLFRGDHTYWDTVFRVQKDTAGTWGMAQSLTTGSPRPVHTTEWGTNTNWWMGSGYQLDGSEEAASQLAVARGADGARHYVEAGRSGTWTSVNDGANWYPAMRGQGVVVAHAVSADPQVSGDARVGESDWEMHSSSDGFTTLTGAPPPVGGADDGTSVRVEAITVDPAPSNATPPSPRRLWAGASNNGMTGRGEVSSSLDDGAHWTVENLYRDAGGAAPLALAVTHPQTAPSETWALTGTTTGVWVKGVGGSTTWTQERSDLTAVQSIAWAPQSPTDVAYVFDIKTGIWRRSVDSLGQVSWLHLWTIDPGVTWFNQVYSQPSSLLATDDGQTLIASIGDQDTSGDPLKINYVSPGLYRITGADARTLPVASTEVSGLRRMSAARPGPLAWWRDPSNPSSSPTELYWAYNDTGLLTDHVRTGRAAMIAKSTDAGVTWTPNIVDDRDDEYAGAALLASGLAIGPDRAIYVSLQGDGLIHTRPC